MIFIVQRLAQPAEPEAAVAIVRVRGPRESILLIRRSDREDDSWSGHWSFPGGHRDPADADLLHTALRELEEECGIRLGPEQHESVIPPVFARRRKGPFVLVAPYVFGVDAELPTVLDSREAVEAGWISRAFLCDPAQHCLQAVPRLPTCMLFPAVALRPVPLWGFTYRVLTAWLSLDPAEPLASAGFGEAQAVLHFLVSCGVQLKHAWEERVPERITVLDSPYRARPPVKTATVEGAIPVTEVLEHFSAPTNHIPHLNLLEVHTDYVRVVGLAFEEYLIVCE